MSSGEASVEVTEAVEALRDADGYLATEAVVDAAADPSSPLHGHFEWLDNKAGHLYRLGQARALIRTLRIPVRIGTALVTSVAYVPAPRVSGSYQRLDEIEPRSETAKAVVLAELSRVSFALSRARKIAAVVDLGHEVDELLDALATVRHRIETKVEPETTA
jgi:hypothetical protein